MSRRPTPNPARAARPRGFTLVEVLVALVVMAIMAVMAWQGVDGIVRARDGSQARMEQTLRMNTVVAQWDQDLGSLQTTSAIQMALSCDGASVRMTRRTPDGLQVVVWSLRPDDSGGTWVRWAGPAVTTSGALRESWMRSLQLQGGEPGSLRTLSGVTAWKVYFYRGNAWANCQSTGDLASPAAGTSGNTGTGSATPPGATPGATPGLVNAYALPTGVRVVLSFADGGAATGELTRDTLIGP